MFLCSHLAHQGNPEVHIQYTEYKDSVRGVVAEIVVSAVVITDFYGLMKFFPCSLLLNFTLVYKTYLIMILYV